MIDRVPLSNKDIVVYALYLIGGSTERHHTEDIAWKCYEVLPSAFSWTKYPQFPDKDIVRVALTDARKASNGGLVEGRAGQQRGQYQKTHRGPRGDGWVLTDAGIEWVHQNEKRLQGILVSAEPREHRQKTLLLLKRVKEHKLFQRFQESPDSFYPSIGELADLLRCRVDAEEVVWRERFDRIRKNALVAGQAEVIAFVERSLKSFEEQWA